MRPVYRLLRMGYSERGGGSGGRSRTLWLGLQTRSIGPHGAAPAFGYALNNETTQRAQEGT
jgi:hypothetical protein